MERAIIYGAALLTWLCCAVLFIVRGEAAFLVICVSMPWGTLWAMRRDAELAEREAMVARMEGDGG